MEQGRYGLTPRIQRRSQSHGLTLQSYEVFLRNPNFRAAKSKKIAFSLMSREKIQQ